MTYALNLAADGRVQSICKALPSTPQEMPRVDTVPEEDCNNYLYLDGKLVYDPLPLATAAPYVPTSEERMAALEDALAASLLGGQNNV